MARTPRSLDEFQSSIEESMAEALRVPGQGDAEPAAVETAASSDADHRTTDAHQTTEPRNEADRLIQACNTTATDIQATGEAVMQVAHSIAAESQALAELLRKHGSAIAARIEEFTAMSKRVSDKLNAARDDVLGSGGAAPSLAPQLEREEKK